MNNSTIVHHAANSWGLSPAPKSHRRRLIYYNRPPDDCLPPGRPDSEFAFLMYRMLVRDSRRLTARLGRPAATFVWAVILSSPVAARADGPFAVQPRYPPDSFPALLSLPWTGRGRAGSRLAARSGGRRRAGVSSCLSAAERSLAANPHRRRGSADAAACGEIEAEAGGNRCVEALDESRCAVAGSLGLHTAGTPSTPDGGVHAPSDRCLHHGEIAA